MRSLIPKIRDAGHPVIAETVLHAEIPLPHAGGMQMRREKHFRIGYREGDILTGRGEGERVASGDVAPRVTELVGAAGERYLGPVGRVLSDHAVGNEGRDGVIEESPAHADGGLSAAGGIVDDAQAGREIRQPFTGEAMGDAGVAGEESSRRRIHVNLADLSGVEGRAGKGTAAVVVIEFGEERLAA